MGIFRYFLEPAIALFFFAPVLITESAWASRAERSAQSVGYSDLVDCPSARFWVTPLETAQILEVEFIPSSVGRWKGDEIRWNCTFAVVLPNQANVQRRLGLARARGAVEIDPHSARKRVLLDSNIEIRGAGLATRVYQELLNVNAESMRQIWLRWKRREDTTWSKCGTDLPLITTVSLNTRGAKQFIPHGLGRLQFGSHTEPYRFQFLLEERACDE